MYRSSPCFRKLRGSAIVRLRRIGWIGRVTWFVVSFVAVIVTVSVSVVVVGGSVRRVAPGLINIIPVRPVAKQLMMVSAFLIRRVRSHVRRFLRLILRHAMAVPVRVVAGQENPAYVTRVTGNSETGGDKECDQLHLFFKYTTAAMTITTKTSTALDGSLTGSTWWGE